MVNKALRRHGAAAPKPNRSPRSPGRFKEREVARALRAVRRAGGIVDRVEVDPATGKIVMILAKPGEAPMQQNPWLADEKQ
jgi:hypothetical protein